MLLAAFVVILCAGFGFAWYEYHKPAADVADLQAEHVDAVELFSRYTANEQQANAIYLNKALEVTGKVLEVKDNQQEKPQIILEAGDPMFGIACTMDKASVNVKPGDKITIKGICTGYLNDVILIKSIQLN